MNYTKGPWKCERVFPENASREEYHVTDGKWGGETVPVAAYYCHDCHTLLTAIGKGEHTPMQDRTEERPDNTPHYKTDIND